MDSYKMSDRLIWKMLFVVCFYSVLGIIYVCLVCTKIANPFIKSFAVDSEGMVYIAEMDSIAVYDEKTKVGQIDINVNRPWYFTITEDDEILYCTSSTVWRIDLEGNELEKKQDNSAQTYSKLQFSSKDEDKHGNTYKRVSYLGRTKIVKNQTEVLYQISVLSYFAKILLYIGLISFPILVGSIIKEEISTNQTIQDNKEN